MSQEAARKLHGATELQVASMLVLFCLFVGYLLVSMMLE